LVGDGFDGEAEDGKGDVGVDGLGGEGCVDRSTLAEALEECWGMGVS
jgi:hypothetical protein